MKPVLKRILVRLLLVAVCLAVFGIIVFSIWRTRLASDVNAEFATIRAAGLPTNGDEENDYYPEVPEKENAAIQMEDAFELLTNFDDRRSNEVATVKFPLSKNSFSAEQLELAAGYVEMNSNALTRVREALQLTHSRYPIDLSLGAETLLPHLTKLKTLAHLADLQAWLNPNDSVVAIETILGMARTLDTEPVLISKLVRIALVGESTGICERRLNASAVTTDELDALNRLFASVNMTNQIANALIGERAMYARYFRMSWADIKKFSDAEDNNPLNGPLPASNSQPFIFKLTGIFERDLRFYLRAMNTNIALAEKFPKNITVISNTEAQMVQTGKRNYYIFSMMLLPALGNATLKEAVGLAQVRMAQTALAVERFRLLNHRLPETLSELVPQFVPLIPIDPCDGQPLRFKLLEKGYSIYSVGKDGEDNGGRERPADAKSSDKTPYDITFTVER